MSVKRTFYNIIAPGLVGALATTLLIGCGQDSNDNNRILSTGNPHSAPMITSVSVGDATESSVTIDWTVSVEAGTDDVPQYEVRYAPGTISQFNWKKASGARTFESRKRPGGYESFTITGLSPSSAYTVGIKAGAAGSEWSEVTVTESHTTDRTDRKPEVIEP